MSAIPLVFLKNPPSFHDLWEKGKKIERDWTENEISPCPQYLLALTPTHLCFLAGRKRSALSHPTAPANSFHPELWKYDVAEFFLQVKGESGYLEFNLAPSGAWWSCFFDRPRVAASEAPLAGVETRSEMTGQQWQAMATLPLDTLPSSSLAQANVCFILESPNQIFITEASPLPGVPDFHRPEAFLPLKLEDDSGRSL